MAARSGVNLDTVLRRYLAGFSVLTEFVLEDAAHAGLPKGLLRNLLRGQTATLDQLLAAVSEEYVNEESRRLSSEEQRRAERVKRLLAGEPLDLSTFEYDFDAYHLGAIASGSGALKIFKGLSSAMGCRLLTVTHDDGTLRAWFGSSRSAGFAQLLHHLSSLGRITAAQQPRFSMALGEPGRGLGGWRRTHRQARAALPIALRDPAPFVRYADVALLASILQDDLLATSLHEIYLAPLQQGRDGGEVALRTLRAYIDAQRNVSSAAAALGVNRNTVANRLRVIEKRIGRPLSSCALEIEATLRLRGLTTLST